MRNDLTVIYYSCNWESPVFADRVRKTLLDTIGDLPLISVSQKPLDFGKNICVGNVGRSGQNALRQFQVGAKEAKTPFVCTAEADTLYPKEYFEFVPPQGDVAYRAMPLYVLFAQRGKARMYCPKVRGSFGATVVGKDCVIEGLDKILNNYGMWGSADEKDHTFPDLFRVIKRSNFTMSIPAISFKTDSGMHRKTPHYAEGRTRDLSYWGNGRALIERYMG